MTFSRSKTFQSAELQKLFSSVDWDSAKKPDILVKAFEKSSHVVSVRNEKNELVGIIRSMDDDIWSANIDCLVVHRDYQNIGLGSILMSELMVDIMHIKYINVCPDSKKMECFYGKFGFKTINGLYMQLIN